VDYEYLSNERKQEIDNLRTIAILGKLSRFSLTLKKDDLVRRTSDTTTTTLSTEKKLGTVDTELEAQATVNDIEEGCPAAETFNNETDAYDRSQYTHVLIPCPGNAFDGDDTKPSPTKDERKQNRIRLFARKELGEKKESNISSKNDTADAQPECKRRDVSIFCAICLDGYEPSERLCYSSNSDCPHVYHEDCIVQWLLSLGRTKCKMQKFSECPNEAQLLNYTLECPSCRQAFICKSVSSPTQEGEEIDV
jgi:hypothetical protein